MVKFNLLTKSFADSSATVTRLFKNPCSVGYDSKYNFLLYLWTFNSSFKNIKTIS